MEQQHIMHEKSQLIEKLRNWKYREAYIRASINVNLPSQIRALRLKQRMTQRELADESKMLQPRISAMEKPGAIKFNIETLVRVAAAFKVGLIVKFVPLSEMLAWENGFSQDDFDVVTFEEDARLQLTAASTPASVIVGGTLSTPTWVSFESPRTMRALPQLSQSITMTRPADAGSTFTVQEFHF